MASNIAASELDEIEDFTTCCICFETYNHLENRPKFLSCHHTCCLGCIKV